jgi:hypothetical protein
MIDAAKLTELELWRTIAEYSAELLAREDRLGVPLLRTRGERTAIEADLSVRVENGENGATLTVENRTFEDAHDSPVRYSLTVTDSLAETIRTNHEQEQRLIKVKLGPQRLRALERATHLLEGYGGLVSFFALKSPKECRDLEKFLAEVKWRFAANRGIAGRERLITNFVCD